MSSSHIGKSHLPLHLPLPYPCYPGDPGQKVLLLSPSALWRIAAHWPMNPRGVEARKRETLIREPADQEDGRLAPQNNHLMGSGGQVLL